MGHQKRKDNIERAKELGRRTRERERERDRKVESNDSPEIQDRRDTLDIPGLPSGAPQRSHRGKNKISKLQIKVGFTVLRTLHFMLKKKKRKEESEVE